MNNVLRLRYLLQRWSAQNWGTIARCIFTVCVYHPNVFRLWLLKREERVIADGRIVACTKCVPGWSPLWRRQRAATSTAKITRDHFNKTVLQLGWRSSRVPQGSLWKQDEKATFRFRADEKWECYSSPFRRNTAPFEWWIKLVSKGLAENNMALDPGVEYLRVLSGVDFSNQHCKLKFVSKETGEAGGRGVGRGRKWCVAW